MTDDHATQEADHAPPQQPLSRNRNFILFLVSRGCAQTGFQTLSVAVGWHVYTRTGDVMNLAYIGLFMFLPFLLLFLPAGLLADRVDRRLIIGGAGLCHACAAALIGLWIGTGTAVVWPVLALLSLNGAAQAFLHPANQAMLPNLVDRATFSRAFATTTTVTRTAQIGSPAIAGMAIALVDTWVYAIIVAAYLACALAARLIQADLRIRSAEPVSLSVVLEGLRHIRDIRLIRAAVLVDLLAVLFGSVTGLLPFIASDVLQAGAPELGLMRSAPAVGGLAVGLLLARYGLPFHAGRSFFVALTAFGLAIVIIGLSPFLWLTVAALVVYGASDMISVVVRQTLVQMGTPDDLRGRVSAVNAVVINASNQIGDFRAGTMAAAVGAPAAIVIGGAATLAVAALWFRFFPELRRIERL